MKKKDLLALALFGILAIWPVTGVMANSHQARFSTAGFYTLAGTGREVFNLNPAWRLYLGDMPQAADPDLDDSQWRVVTLPNGIELLPAEASGCINYQGPVWYRKRFRPDARLQGKRLFLHFEAIMGKSEIWLNGEKLQTHYGGYLPIVVDVTGKLQPGTDNVIAVKADNSDCPDYPPGKAQDVLDFAYFGGIYRDCWLVAHNQVYITDPNAEQEVAGGGLFVSYSDVSSRKAGIRFDLHVRNTTDQAFRGRAEFRLYDPTGQLVLTRRSPLKLAAGTATSISQQSTLKEPALWSPEQPNLYRLEVRLTNNRGKTMDGYMRRIGIRSFEFKGSDGFWLNGHPYEHKLIGANRHQDYAVVGNALSNSLHWRDAKKLRDAGLKVIRNAHYPQDPAFMDACDELGLLVIVNTPGWQFWNKAPHFAQRVYNDIRQMVRRDRNHPCVWLWEPILNETWYPDSFARKVDRIVHEEYPYASCYTACDSRARGHEFYKVQFCHPSNGNPSDAEEQSDSTVTYFTREWGDCVDDWNSHNSPSRVNRDWGEVPMLVQARHYSNPPYPYTCYETLCQTPRQHVGGALWHSFDHQRGYHPDPFYGGIMDVFRQPKTSYYLFKSQRDPNATHPLAESGPMVYIAHAMTPFSPADVTVYSNCDTVRLIAWGSEGTSYTYVKNTRKNGQGMPYPPITFKNVFSSMKDKALSRSGKQKESYLLAEGIRNGKVAATHKVTPSRRPSKLLLWADNEEQPLKADGSDLVTLVAAVADGNGVIKRLNNYTIRFEVEGEGLLVGNHATGTNPTSVRWGTAPILLRATTRPGKIKIRASVIEEGKHTPVPAELELESVPADVQLLYDADVEANRYRQPATQLQHRHAKRISAKKLKEVEQQQADFE